MHINHPPSDTVNSQAESEFITFILSLGTATLMNLGEIPDFETQQVVADLDAAEENIRIISLLREKTKGNLDPQEFQMLETILYDLRLKFVKAKELKK